MVKRAVAAGHQATDRLFADWQEVGLIDQPVKRGLGRGKGILALWPESQLRLWLLLLDKRKETSQIPNLCNVPVGLWVYFGDEYVSLRQVRKCMTTWSERYGSSRGHKMAKQTARQLLDDLPIVGLSRNAKADLVTSMATALLQGIKHDDDRRKLRTTLMRAVGVDPDHPESTNRAAAVVDMVLVRLLASHHLSRGSVPDHIFEWARAWHLYGLRRYMDALDSGNLPAMPGVAFDRPDFDRLIPSTCRDLMSAIGMALGLKGDEALPAPFFHPDSWKDGQGKAKLSFEIQPTPIVLPNGRQHGTLRIRVAGRVGPDPDDALL